VKYIDDILQYKKMVTETLAAISDEDINNLLELLMQSLYDERQIFVFGNGGSASTASHYVCDFNKGLSYGKGKRFKFICLNDNFPTVAAYANDISYDVVFEEQLKNFMREGDYVIGISGSGNSTNVLRGIAYANTNNAVTIGLVGYDGGELKRICQHCVHVPIENMQVVEDLHMVLDHLAYFVLDKYLY
jgi:D-sedoheptulose 7-phosphate isomerase